MLYRTKPFYDNNNEKLVNTDTNKLNQWFTNVECSWTGTTIDFEQPQDRTILIDLRFLRKFILRSLHALYVAAKWEKLGTIAMKFNALSDHYFADLTSPLLIAAQTALLQQLRDRQNSIAQPHFDPAISALGRPIHSEGFHTLRPEKLFHITDHTGENTSRSHSASTLSLGARLDPKGSDYYAQTNRALELISIPLDVEMTRKLLRQSLDKTYYSSRSIIECRKMLAFYIYKQEEQLAKDLLIFTPIIENVQQHEEQVPTKKENPSTLYYRPLTAGEPMDFLPSVNNKIDTSPSTQITKESVIEAYQTLSNYQNAVAKRIDNRQLLSFDTDAVGRSNLFFLHVLPRFAGVTQTLQSLSHYSSQCIAIYPSDIYSQNVLQITSSSNDKLPQRASISSGHTLRSAQTSASGMHLINEEDLAHCPNINLNMMKRELPDSPSTVAFSLAWYSSNTILIKTAQKQNQRALSSIYGFYTTAKDDLINVVSVPLDQLLNLHKKYLPIAQVAETDPKQINQNQIQPILQEVSTLLTGEQAVKTSNDDGTVSKPIPRLMDPKAYVERESFLNAKFDAESHNTHLRDWFINTLKQSSNTFLSAHD